MHHFSVGPAAFFIPTARCAYRIDCHQCTTLYHDQKSKTIDFQSHRNNHQDATV